MTPTDFLKKHIDEYNSTVNDMHKFKLSERELKMFTAAITEYASLNRQGWTRVEDGLPKEGERVFIYYKNEHGKYWRDVAFYTYGKVVEFDDEQDDFPECFDPEKGIYLLPKGFWFNSEVDENLFNRLNVTHWMPLPNKPETI